MGRKDNKEATTPYATTVAYARLTDLVKYGRVSRAQWSAAAQLGAAKILEYAELFPYRGAQLWHLVGEQPVAVAWIDGPTEGVQVFSDVDAGRDHYARVCADLAERDPIETKKRRS